MGITVIMFDLFRIFSGFFRKFDLFYDIFVLYNTVCIMTDSYHNIATATLPSYAFFVRKNL